MSSLLTAEQFVESRDDLPDGGRWTELHAGKVVHLSPPDDEHGNAVLNLTKALSKVARPDRVGYPCFELGLILERNPDTVWAPAVSYFTTGEVFAEADKVVTDVCPSLVVEVASSADRRRNLSERIARWLAWGVPAVWVLDPPDKRVHVFAPPRSPRELRGEDVVEGGTLIPGFAVSVQELFALPHWWK